MDTATTAHCQSPPTCAIKNINWWLLLLGPLAALAAVVYSRFEPEVFHHLQVSLETPTPWLVAAVAVIYAVRFALTRNRLFLLLAGLATAFTLREFHFDWTHKGIYIMLVGLGIFALLCRKNLRVSLGDWRHTSWLLATFGAYFLSQLIARRAFRIFPGEHEIHRSLEECVETAAHVLFLVTSLVGSWRHLPTRPTHAETAPQNADR